MKHLLKLMDLTGDEILALLNLADQLKYERRHGIPHHRLTGKTLGMIFQKSSTRTRVSFEVGMYELGGTALFLSDKDLQIGRGEGVDDTARVLSRYLSGIMIRTFAQDDVEKLARYGSIPVINGLTDFAHPCQVLADLMTIREYKGALAGQTLCYIGDGNNMANSLIVGGLKAGMRVRVACPKGYEPAPEVLAFAQPYGDACLVTDDPALAARGADALYTDVWASMGQEGEREARAKAFAGYQVNMALLAAANPGCVVLHCLPAHKGEEISPDVFEAHAAEIFDQAENRLHVQKAVLLTVMG
ncbi:MAG: ornithine carbamoyltransferase [Oscillospiraceae bacterium]|jgi:ornithine carbamoyltransferase|nr:ornithine carbamoyltransferase [Oscillospiraceae bacterium]